MNRNLLLGLGGVAVALSGVLPLRVIEGTTGTVPFVSTVHAGLPVIVAGALVVVTALASAGGLLRQAKAALVAAVSTAFAIVMTTITASAFASNGADIWPGAETTSRSLAAGLIVFVLGVLLIAGFIASALFGPNGSDADARTVG